MRNKRVGFALIVVLTSLYSNRSTAQQSKPSEPLPRYEVGVDFSTLTRSEGDTDAGLGGRFTYNWNRHVALEAAGYFFPGKCRTCTGEITGHITEGFFGIKAGQRFKRFGIFGKVRPGLINYSRGFFDIVPTGESGPFPFRFVVRDRTNFATDVGGVLEIYPKKRFLLRFDGSVIYDRMGRTTFHAFDFAPFTSPSSLQTFTTPPFTRKYFQFTAGVGFRF